jgi:hypothetical protein
VSIRAPSLETAAARSALASSTSRVRSTSAKRSPGGSQRVRHPRVPGHQGLALAAGGTGGCGRRLAPGRIAGLLGDQPPGAVEQPPGRVVGAGGQLPGATREGEGHGRPGVEHRCQREVEQGLDGDLGLHLGGGANHLLPASGGPVAVADQVEGPAPGAERPDPERSGDLRGRQQPLVGGRRVPDPPHRELELSQDRQEPGRGTASSQVGGRLQGPCRQRRPPRPLQHRHPAVPARPGPDGLLRGLRVVSAVGQRLEGPPVQPGQQRRRHVPVQGLGEEVVGDLGPATVGVLQGPALQRASSPASASASGRRATSAARSGWNRGPNTEAGGRSGPPAGGGWRSGRAGGRWAPSRTAARRWPGGPRRGRSPSPPARGAAGCRRRWRPLGRGRAPGPGA